MLMYVLSWLPLQEQPQAAAAPSQTIALVEQLVSIPLIANQIKNMTDQDPVLAKAK